MQHPDPLRAGHAVGPHRPLTIEPAGSAGATEGRPSPLLLAVPNLSGGRDLSAVEEVARSFAPAQVLDLHADPDHGRSVVTCAAPQGTLWRGLLAGARAAVARLDLRGHEGVHPRIGVVDVAPVVYLREEDRGAACAEALTLAALMGEDLELPVFLYGDLATAPERRERAALRQGGPARLAARLEAGELTPDHGPPRAHPSAGAVLVTARPPLVAFNLDLASADVAEARRIASVLRESGGGPPGVRAIGLHLATRGRAQVSMNVHDHRVAPLARLVDIVRHEADVVEAEIVGLAPAAALEGFPADLPLRGFDPDRHVIENALRSIGAPALDDARA